MMRRRSSEHGGAAIEFALIVPMLSALLLGMMEAGRFTSRYQAASVCVRVGAREASRTAATTSSVQAATNTCLTDADFSAVTPTLSPSNPASAAPGDKMTVSFDLAYSSWFGLQFTSTAMHFSCSMIKEH
jgi:Flp pilus assembly protein TadG